MTVADSVAAADTKKIVFEVPPANMLVAGVTRSADALLIEEVAREAGYVPVATPSGLGASGWALAPR